MKKNKSGAIILFLTSFYSFLFLPLAPLWAQSLDLPSDADIFAPVVQHERPRQSMGTEESLLVEATVTDDVQVKEVILFFRTTGAKRYSSINMEPGRKKDTYLATIPKGDISVPGLDYYIQASDKAGNTSLRGFSFSPLTIMVSPLITPKREQRREAVIQEKEVKILTDKAEILHPVEERHALRTGPTLEKPWYKKWWVWTIAVVVIGAAASGGGGGGGDTSAGTPPLATGTASISSTAP